MFYRLPLLLVTLTSLSCSDQPAELAGEVAVESATAQRWYDPQQVEIGRAVFQQHCAQCHGLEAQGLAGDWRERLADGSFPPPPLNGSAHAWHHPLPILLQVINQGGIPLGGKMPAFSDVLEQDEKLAAIAYFQHYWSDEIYQQWERMGGVN